MLASGTVSSFGASRPTIIWKALNEQKLYQNAQTTHLC